MAQVLEEQRNFIHPNQWTDGEGRGRGGRAGRKSRNSYKSSVISKAELGVLVGFLPLLTTKCRVKEYARLTLSSYFVWSERTIRYGWFLKTAQNREISGAPRDSRPCQQEASGTDTSTWEHSDAARFLFHFKIYCWEFSLHNTLAGKCLERNGSQRRIKHEPPRLWMDTEGIKYFKVKVEKFIWGGWRGWREILRGAAERKTMDSIYLDPHLSFDLCLITWPSPCPHAV